MLATPEAIGAKLAAEVAARHDAADGAFLLGCPGGRSLRRHRGRQVRIVGMQREIAEVIRVAAAGVRVDVAVVELREHLEVIGYVECQVREQVRRVVTRHDALGAHLTGCGPVAADLVGTRLQ